MPKSRRGILFALGMLGASFPVFAFAAVSITEVMYDVPGTDTGREWVEIQNTGSDSVEIATSSWKFFEANTNHGLSLLQGSATLPAGGFAVIVEDSAKFLADWPSFSGTLFKASFSLSNTGETIALKSSTSTVVDQTTYDTSVGAGGDGNSLQKIGSIWQAKAPTPGAAAVSSQNASSGQSGGSDSGGQSTTTSSDDTSGTTAVQTTSSDTSGGTSASSANGSIGWNLEPRIFVSAKVPAKGIAGADIAFDATAVGLKKEPIVNARYVWSFGDGASLEGKKVYHAYHYPGSYVVLVDASSGEWEASERHDITISAPLLVISDIQPGPDGFIQVQNNGKDDIELSRWFLKVDGAFFTFPNGTMVKAGRSVPFPSEITHLTASAEDTELLYPNGKTVAKYAPAAAPAAEEKPARPASADTPRIEVASEPKSAPTPPVQTAQKQKVKDSAESSDSKEEASTTPTAGLSAAAAQSGSGSAKWFLGALAMSLVGAGGYLFVVRGVKGKAPNIVEGISADEFDIVE